MKTGIVLNILEGEAQILLAGGKVTTVPARAGWQLGDLVILKKRSVRWLWLLAAVGVLVLFLSLGAGWLYSQETAVISLDINPSVELGINRFHRVVSVRAWNVDGERLISGVRVTHQSYTDAVQTLLETYERTNALEEAPLLVITVWAKERDEETAVLLGLKELAALNRFGEVAYAAVDTALLKQAHAVGVSAGKYQYLEELKELEPELNLAVYRDHTIEQIKEDIAAGKQAALSPSDEPLVPEPTPEGWEPETGLEPGLDFQPGCGYNKHHQE